MKTATAALGAAFLLAASPMARAQVQCAPGDAAADSLRAAGYEMTVTGPDDQGAVMEIWENAEGAWMLLVRPSQDLTVRCGIAGGPSYTMRRRGEPVRGDARPEPAPGEGAESRATPARDSL